MARIRNIKPEFWTSVPVSRLSHRGRLLFQSIWTHADDGGVVAEVVPQLRVQTFPYDSDVTDAQIEGDIAQMIDVGLLRRSQATARNNSGSWHGTQIVDVLVVCNWHEHQKTQKPTKKYVLVEDGLSDSGTTTGKVLESSDTPPVPLRYHSDTEKEKEKEKEKDKRPRSKPTSVATLPDSDGLQIAMGDPPPPTVGQIANQITTAFYESQQGAVNFQSVRGVVTKLLKADYEPKAVATALAQAEHAGKPLTVDVLRQILAGRRGGKIQTEEEIKGRASLRGLLDQIGSDKDEER